MRTQPNFGLRCFISTMAAISCSDGPFGPGFRLWHGEENSRRYFRWTMALWSLNRVAGLILTDNLGIRCGLSKTVVNPSTRRSSMVRLGARRRDRLLISSWGLSKRDLSYDPSHATRAEEFGEVTSRWIAKISTSRMSGK